MSGTPITSADLYQDKGHLKALRQELADIDAELQKIPASASKILGSIGKINTNTRQGQAQARQAATDAEKLIRAEQALNASRTLTVKKIEEVRNATARQNQENRAAARIANAVKDSYDALSGQYSINKIRLNAMSRAQRENTLEGRKLVRETKAIHDEMKRLQAVTGNNTLNVGNYSSAVKGLVVSFRSLAAAYLSVSGAQQLIQNIFGQTKALNGLDIAFQQVIGSSGGAATAQSFLRDLTERLGIDLVLTSKSYLKFVAAANSAGLAQEQTNQIFESFAKVGSTLGLSAAELDRLFKGLEQTLSKGSVSSEELRGQIGDVLPGAFTTAAKAIGVTTGELQKLLKDGKVVSADFLPKFAKAAEEAFGVQATDRVDNLASAQGRFRREITLIIEELNASNTFKDFFEILTSIFRVIRENLSLIGSLTKGVLLLAGAYGAWRLGIVAVNTANLIGIPILQRAIAQKGLFTTATVLATRAQTAFNLAIRTNPIGFLSVALITAITLLSSFKAKASDTAKSMSDIDIAVKNNTEGIKKSKAEFGLLIDTLKRVAVSEESRKHAIEKLNTTYAAYLPKLITEKTSLDEINASLAYGNRLFEEKITLMAFQASLDAQTDKIIKNRADKIDLELKETELLRKRNELTGQGLNFTVTDELTDPVEINRANVALQDLNKQLAVNQAEQNRLQTEYERTIELARQSGVDMKALFETIEKGPGSGGGKGGDDIKDEFKRLRELNSLREDGQEKELEALRIFIAEKQHEYKDDAQVLIALEEYSRNERANILNKYIDIEDAAKTAQELREKSRLERLALAFQNYYNRIASAINAGLQKRDQTVDLLQEELEARQDHEKKVLELTDHTAKEAKEIEIRHEIEKLKLKIQLHKEGLQILTQLEVDRINEVLGLLQSKLAGLKNDTGDQHILNFIGFDLDDKQLAAIDGAFNLAKDHIRELNRLEEERTQIAVDNAQKRVDAAQKELDAQRENLRAGYAANISGAENELKAAKKQQQEALKQQAKFQKSQIILNTALEASNITLAIAKILGASINPVLSIPLIGLLITSFVAAKVKALSAVKKTFRKGTYQVLGGGSHESGNDTYVGTNRKGENLYAEKGEGVAVVTAKANRKYGSTLPGLFKALNAGRLEKYISQHTQMREGIPMISNVNVNTRVMEDEIRGLRRDIKSTPSRFINQNGDLVVKYKNRTTIYRKPKQ